MGVSQFQFATERWSRTSSHLRELFIIRAGKRFKNVTKKKEKKIYHQGDVAP